MRDEQPERGNHQQPEEVNDEQLERVNQEDRLERMNDEQSEQVNRGDQSKRMSYEQSEQGNHEQLVNPTNTEQVVIVKQTENNGMAIAALILGIFSVFLAWIPLIPYVTAILAIVFGFLGMKVQIQKTLGIIGIILGGATFILKIGFWILFILGIAAELSY